MPDNLRISSELPGQNARSGQACPELLAVAKPELYRRNPFRQLGLSVLSGARELARRVDQLKLAAELDGGAPEWSFASEQAPDAGQVRAAAQKLKEPAVRFVYELFWFWPENYPDEPVSDEALDHLARGETAQALEIWQGAATLGRLSALHNLAVYYHQQVLELESLEKPPEEELIQLWFKALRFWEKIGAEDELWTRLEARVVGLADARVTADFVAQLRLALPEALSGLCATLALHHGEAGRGDRAALHAAMVTHIHGDTAGARHALEVYSSPIARRIDTRLIELEKRTSGGGATGLNEVMTLLRSCDEDLRLIELLCGRTSDYYVEVSHVVADAALDGLVVHQRETHNDRSCLPVLIHLLDMEAIPELRSRMMTTFEAVYTNALTAAAAAAGNDGEGGPENAVAAECAQSLQLIAGEIVPGLEALGLGENSRQLYAARTAGLLKNLAIKACLECDDLEMAQRAFALAFELPLRDALRESLEVDRAQLQMDFEVRREKELHVEGEGHVLLVNRHGICLDGRWTSPDEIAGLRHGIKFAAGPGGAEMCSIGWLTVAGEEFGLDATNLLPPSTYVREHYSRIVDSIFFFLVPPLIERQVRAIRAGEEVMLGTTVLGPDGMRPGPKARFWERDQPVPFARLETSVEDGRLIVSSVDDARLSETYDVANIWNATIFRYVVEALLRE